MKKAIAAVLAVILFFSFGACVKKTDTPDVSVLEGEMMLTGRVTRVSGSLIILESTDSSISNKFSFGYSDGITVVENEAVISNYSADSLKDKKITVICNQLVQETYPAGLVDVRMIIIG